MFEIAYFLNFWIIRAQRVHCIFRYFSVGMHFTHLFTQNIRHLVQQYAIWDAPQVIL